MSASILTAKQLAPRCPCAKGQMHLSIALLRVLASQRRYFWRLAVRSTDVAGLLLVFISGWLLVSCSRPPASTQAAKPQQAGQPVDPAVMAAKMAAIDAAALRGDQQGLRDGIHSATEDFRRSIKLADPGRRIDPELARVAAKSVSGVRSVVWLDRENLFAIVERNEQRSYDTIDAICLNLEPLGDTLSVVVNLQSGAARSGDELAILSRNCQLTPGDRALLQRTRNVDVIDPAIRAQHKANQSLRPAVDDKTAAESLRIIEESTPDVRD